MSNNEAESTKPEDLANDAQETEGTDSATPDLEAAQSAAAALAQENAELKDKLLRSVAEMENLRKRTEREVREAGQYAIAAFARDILAVGDNLQRALDTVKPEDAEGAKIAFESMREGVTLTRDELLRQMDRHGIKPIPAQGEKFDPNLHQAIFEVPDPSVPSGTVLQVTQEGYMIGERVLRPAMVGVSKGGPRQGAPKAEEEAPQESEEHVDKTV